MPGKLDSGKKDNNSGIVQNSRAYCEGRNYRAAGSAASNPVTDNPHLSGSEAFDAWGAGWLQVDGIADGSSFVGPDSACGACGIVAV